MKRLLIALALLLLPSAAFAQCNGVFPNNTACGNISGSSNTPRAVPLSSFPANAPGGTTGQVQYNAGAGLFGGIAYPSNATTFLDGNNAYITPPTFGSGAPGYVPAAGGTSTSLFLNQAGGFTAPTGTTSIWTSTYPWSVVQGDPTGATDSTAAFQTAIDFCRSGSEANCAVLVPPGRYQIRSVNCTNMNGLTIMGTGSLTYNTVISGNTDGVAMFDCTGSEGMRFRDLEFSTLSGKHPAIGIQIAPSTVTGGMDNIGFDNVALQGNWSSAALYLDRLGSSYMKKVQVINDYGVGTSYGVVFTANNILNITSQFVTTKTGSSNVSDWNLYDIDFHAIYGSGNNTEPLFLDGAEGFRFWGGNISCSGCDILVRFQDESTSLTNQIIFSGTGFYDDAAPNYVSIFGGAGGVRGISFDQIGATNVGSSGHAFDTGLGPVYAGAGTSTQEYMFSGSYSSTPIFIGPQASSTTESVAGWYSSNRLIAARMYTTLSAAPSSDSVTATLRYGTSSTVLTSTITGSANTANNVTNWVELNPLSQIDVEVVATGGATGVVHVTVEFMRIGPN